jgi:DNA-directed RNA polymerase subunit RPC12/RpoP
VHHRWDRRKGQQCRAHLIEHFGYECAICKKPLTSQPRVDHNHTTGEVRGLLCSHCNVGIGMLQDDEALLRVAADYLRDQEQKTQGVLDYAAQVERLKQEHIARHGLKCDGCSKPIEEKKLSLVGGKLEEGASRLLCPSCHRVSLGAKLYADWVQGASEAA